MPGSVIVTGGDGGNGSLAFIFLNLISHLLSDALQGFICIQLFNSREWEVMASGLETRVTAQHT